ncbi:MBL fold metallo-hydrolase [Streptomyces sp. NPDC059568]|uniref:MBL fold metallo-hydrolase n=1 Tax=Streptomyces sp. NPDC059568 TaxID=3346868 RepID=UPI0036A5275C
MDLIDLVEISSRLHMLRFPIGQAYLWRDGGNGRGGRGDELDFGDGARVVHAPGHTDGSIAVHLSRHGVLFVGDTIASVGGIALGVFNVDRERAQESMRRLVAPAPSTVCYGHGDPTPGFGDLG